MSTPRQGRFPGQVRQVGHVVRDLDVAVKVWRAAGVGPWSVLEVPLRDGTCRGEPSEPVLRLGAANIGDLQIELIEVAGDGPSIWHEARDAARFGPHHLAYWAEDFDDAVAEAVSGGPVVVQLAGGGPLPRFAYLEADGGGLLLEIMELSPRTRQHMDAIREASRTWDGVS